MQIKEVPTNVKLHGIKCYNISARGIKCMSYCKEFKKLGVVRNDNTIEIWNMANAPFLERTIPGSFNSTVEAICWAGLRLFSVGLSGDGLKEWDLQTLTPKRCLLLTGEKGFCMDIHHATGLIAIGTEEGLINIFDTNDDDLQYVRVLDRQDNRIICCKFHDDGGKLVSGSIDAVKLWNVKTGHVIHKMSTSRSETNQETIVWCIEVLHDLTIVTGDSRGRVTFWDGILGAQIDWIQASQVDIMCLTVAEDQNSIFCSGVEQILKKYTRVAVKRGDQQIDQWIRSAKRSKIHTHDVLAMATVGNDQLISGGFDGFLSFASHDLKEFARSGPFLSRPFAITAEQGRLMLMKYVNYLEVWKLAGANQLSKDFEESNNLIFDENDDVLRNMAVSEHQKTQRLYKISEFPEKYLELRSKNDEQIVCCAISNDGHWIAYATEDSIRIFRFAIQDNGKPQLSLMKNVPSEFTPCLKMLFTKDSKSMIMIKVNGKCEIFQLQADGLEHQQTIDASEYHKDIIHLMTISKCSKFLALASLCNVVTVWTLKKKTWIHLKKLPRYNCPATVMDIRRDQPSLVIVYSDHKLIEYDFEQLLVKFTTKLPAKSTTVDTAITNICLDPNNSNSIIYNKENEINVLSCKGNDEQKIGGKKTKTELEENISLKVVKSFNNYLINLEWLGDNELLALEVNPIALVENLPAPLRKKAFGMT